MDMIDAITTRRMTHNGVPYQKGQRVRLPAGQFADLEALGFVARAEPVVRRSPTRRTRTYRRKAD